MPKEYPTKFKTEVIQRYRNGESIQLLSQELHIAQSTIYHWRKEYCSIKTANRTYTPKEFDELSRRLVKLEHEMEMQCACWSCGMGNGIVATPYSGWLGLLRTA